MTFYWTGNSKLVKTQTKFECWCDSVNGGGVAGLPSDKAKIMTAQRHKSGVNEESHTSRGGRYSRHVARQGAPVLLKRSVELATRPGCNAALGQGRLCLIVK